MPRSRSPSLRRSRVGTFAVPLCGALAVEPHECPRAMSSPAPDRRLSPTAVPRMRSTALYTGRGGRHCRRKKTPRAIRHARPPGVRGSRRAALASPPSDARALASSLDPRPAWLDRFAVDASVMPGKFVIKVTRFLVDDLVRLAAGQTVDRLRQLHPELTTADLEAIRNCALVPLGLRRSFGGWVEDAEALDGYIEWTRL